MVAGFLLAAGLTIFGGVLGHGVIMKIQKYLTLVTVVMTIVYIGLTIDSVNWSAVSAIPSGSTQSFIGAMVLGITGIGLGWVNSAADYSRYLPRSVSSKAVVGWTVLAHLSFPSLW